jgi:tetraacyldisaccharide 4'-kinase
MRAPAFWNAPAPTPAARLLAPLGAIYGAVAAARMTRPGTGVGLPVICVGNFTAGGAGKTPAALALAERLAAQGRRVAFLSRGHGGSLSGRAPVVVDAATHRAEEVGDEPLLLARAAPTVIGVDRVAAAQRARRLGAEMLIMDDGLQNPSLAKDEAIAVVDAAVGIGNGLCLPAGPLRAPMAAQWDHVDAVLIVGEGAAGQRLAQEAAARGKRVERARLAPDAAVVAALSGRPLMAFAGIGRPQKFFATLAQAGLETRVALAFADHRRYRPGEIDALLARAAREGLTAVTTEKDLVRLDPDARARALDSGLVALPARLVFDS